MPEPIKPVEPPCYVQKTDPDLLLALDTITKAIEDLKPEPPVDPNLYTIECFDFPGEEPQKWTTTLVLLIMVILAVFCLGYQVNSFFSTMKNTQETMQP